MNSLPTDAQPTRQSYEALLARRRNYRQEVLDLTRTYPKVVFYGCGAILNSIVETWTEYVGRPIDFTCDSDPAKWGQTYCGARCLSPTELTAIKDQCAVFVTVGDFRPVYDLLVERGFPSVHLIYKYDLAAAAYLAQHAPAEIAGQLSQTRALLADARSRDVFDAIATRVLEGDRDVGIMARVCEAQQYFPADIIRLSLHESFVDVGAYNGDTVLDFVRRSQGRFDRLHAFEVDANNYRQLEETVRALPARDRITIHNLGLWDAAADITYSIGHSQSTVGRGEGRGHVEPLDAVLPDAPVTFIKMDIEGAEMRALRGARRIIQTQRPTLAICIYHDFQSLWDIPLYLHALVPEYRLYLRHHTNLEYETVCYAV